MVTPELTRIRNSVEYKEWRNKVFKRDNYTCQICNERSRKGRHLDLEADHIKSFVLFPELRFVTGNGRTLCEDCHSKTETYGYKNRNDIRSNCNNN